MRDFKALERYPYCGHGAILGQMSYEWQDRHGVLAQFGRREAQALEAYRRFVKDGIVQRLGGAPSWSAAD